MSGVICLLSITSIPGNSHEDGAQNVAILDIVWNTVNERYFDPEFGGLDWAEQYRRYKPIIASCGARDSLYDHLNKMLFQLGVSHLGVASPEEVDEIADPQLFLDGTAGLDVRYVKDEAVVTSVDETSSAARAGIKPGYIVLEMNENSVREIAAERKREPTPPFNERNLTSMITQDLTRELYGTPGDTVTLVYVDVKGDRITTELELRERAEPKSSVIGDLPDIYARVSGRLLNDRLAYIRFNVFHPIIRDSVLSLIDEYIDKPSMIIDIRGNPGGEFNTRRAIASKFVSERTLFWIYRSRDGVREVFLDPTDHPYQGKVVILVDELSGSSSEEFAGGMQAIGRATIVGNRTAGKVLTMEVMPLPDGAVLIYPDSQTRTSKNEILEGKGVTPDIEVGLNRSSLLGGRDPQLEAAIGHLMME